jgi:DNA polymerase V
LYRLVPCTTIQGDLFGDFDLALHDKQTRMMGAVDLLNRAWGHDTIFFGAQGTGERSWQMRQLKCSPCYTTRRREVMVVHAR